MSAVRSSIPTSTSIAELRAPGRGASAAPTHAAPISGAAREASDPLVELIIQRRLAGQQEYQKLGRVAGVRGTKESPADFLFLTEEEPHGPDEVFERLRWGGQVVIVSRSRRAVQAAARSYETWRMDQSDHAAWAVEHPLEREGRFPLSVLGWYAPVYFMTARKMMLVPPGRFSDRFTYHVQLGQRGGEYEVVKEIPTVERVMMRLREKFPEADEETLWRRARKFTEKIFPVFLTRETAMLKLLQRDMPAAFRERVPRLLGTETDEAGFTRTLRMSWLRNARPIVPGWKGHGAALSQLEFARQAAELLTALHDDVGIMHLDLRLDNVVITENGVGFVDFGSAVRVGEEFPEASLLSNLFDEMMRTSQIQRMLGKMAEAGKVTSEEITGSHERIDKAVDFFYLALQINDPLSNPDFAGLVEHDRKSREARELARLTEKILRPANPREPEYTSARDILRGIQEIGARLEKAER
jgi:hypothetical protein